MEKRKKKKKEKSTSRVIGEALAALVVVWRETLKRPRRRALVAALLLAFVVAMLVARIGTLRARAGSGAVFAVVLAGAVFVALRERKRWDDPRAVIQSLAGRADPDRAERALRALTLLDEDGEPRDAATSPTLARLHVARQLALLPHDAIIEEASRAALRTNIAAIAIGVVVLALGGSHAFSVIEGADVLVATSGTAPLGLPYVEDLTLLARPPEYLHQEERKRSVYGHLSLPRGTLLTFRGEAIHAGRRLLVTDGKNEIPFVDDGGGLVVARWPLAESASLRVVARFGDVIIPEPNTTEVTSIADETPKVILEGAPKTISLSSPEGESDIPIRYEATDDHGLRQVELVLTSGSREERRVLARLDGETREDRGGSVLKPKASTFIRKSHAPVFVRVEAKDNDPITGPKWGASESFTLLPPDVGQAEATRLDALRALRDAYVDTLAWRMENSPGPSTFLADEKRGAETIARTLDHTLLGSGLAIPSRLTTLLKTHQKKVELAIASEQKGGTSATHAKVVSTTETMVLVIDGIVRGLAHKDARTVSKQLADVADDLAQGLNDERTSHDLPKAKMRVDASEHVLASGEKQLAKLGTLGRDLAGATRAGLARVDRAILPGDLPHAELAARDLAARLREADPSFGSRGGTGGHATGESGGEGNASDGEGGDSSDAEKAFNEASQDLEQLDQDHAGEMGRAEQALGKSLGEDEMKQIKDAAKPHAAAVREAVKDLPSVGGGSDTWSSKASAAREHAEQMARSLESGSPSDAVSSANEAIDAIKEAKTVAARERYSSWSDPSVRGAEKKLDDAQKKLEVEQKWAQDQVAQMQKKAAENARGDLKKSGEAEGQLADRTKKLAEKARSQSSLPDQALDSLDDAERAAREAANALEQGEAERGTQKQREAQRALDAAKQALGDTPKDEGELNSDHDGEGRDANGNTDVPKAGDHKGPEEFRKRVLRGLAEPSQRKNKDAIRRYAEGLLR